MLHITRARLPLMRRSGSMAIVTGRSKCPNVQMSKCRRRGSMVTGRSKCLLGWQQSFLSVGSIIISSRWQQLIPREKEPLTREKRFIAASPTSADERDSEEGGRVVVEPAIIEIELSLLHPIFFKSDLSTASKLTTVGEGVGRMGRKTQQVMGPWVSLLSMKCSKAPSTVGPWWKNWG